MDWERQNVRQEGMWLILHQGELSYSSRLILLRAPASTAHARWLETDLGLLGCVTNCYSYALKGTSLVAKLYRGSFDQSSVQRS